MRNINSSSAKVHDAAEARVSAFRSDIQVRKVCGGLADTTARSGVLGDDVKVSEFRLESYLNACSPTCHG